MKDYKQNNREFYRTQFKKLDHLFSTQNHRQHQQRDESDCLTGMSRNHKLKFTDQVKFNPKLTNRSLDDVTIRLYNNCKSIPDDVFQSSDHPRYIQQDSVSLNSFSFCTERPDNQLNGTNNHHNNKSWKRLPTFHNNIPDYNLNNKKHQCESTRLLEKFHLKWPNVNTRLSNLSLNTLSKHLIHSNNHSYTNNTSNHSSNPDVNTNANKHNHNIGKYDQLINLNCSNVTSGNWKSEQELKNKSNSMKPGICFRENGDLRPGVIGRKFYALTKENHHHHRHHHHHHHHHRLHQQQEHLHREQLEQCPTHYSHNHHHHHHHHHQQQQQQQQQQQHLLHTQQQFKGNRLKEQPHSCQKIVANDLSSFINGYTITKSNGDNGKQYKIGVDEHKDTFNHHNPCNALANHQPIRRVECNPTRTVSDFSCQITNGVNDRLKNARPNLVSKYEALLANYKQPLNDHTCINKVENTGLQWNNVNFIENNNNNNNNDNDNDNDNNNNNNNNNSKNTKSGSVGDIDLKCQNSTTKNAMLNTMTLNKDGHPLTLHTVTSKRQQLIDENQPMKPSTRHIQTTSRTVIIERPKLNKIDQSIYGNHTTYNNGSGTDNRGSTINNNTNTTIENDAVATNRNQLFLPISPQTALKLHGKNLTMYEREEITSYKKIWFLGLGIRKIEAVTGVGQNDGYDDESGGYLKVTHDHIAYRFQALETLGKGSFGRVIRAVDHKTGQCVAIKIIRNKKRFHHQAQVEVSILQSLKQADPKNLHHIIHIKDNFVFRNHICIVFDLMGLNLYELLKRNEFRGFTFNSLKKIATKLIDCLCLLKKLGIIHCDLKPENILTGLHNPSDLRIIDFGSSCYANKRTYTYIQSRFYRAPEVILGIPYGMPIDMWSFGCILPELYTGRPIFPGENENEQLSCLMEVLGQPPESMLDKATRRRVFFDSKGSPRHLINSRGRKRVPGSRKLEDHVNTTDSKFIDFLSLCLTWNAEDRITPEAALSHDWLQTPSTCEEHTHRSLCTASDASHRSGCISYKRIEKLVK